MNKSKNMSKKDKAEKLIGRFRAYTRIVITLRDRVKEERDSCIALNYEEAQIDKDNNIVLLNKEGKFIYIIDTADIINFRSDESIGHLIASIWMKESKEVKGVEELVKERETIEEGREVEREKAIKDIDTKEVYRKVVKVISEVDAGSILENKIAEEIERQLEKGYGLKDIIYRTNVTNDSYIRHNEVLMFEHIDYIYRER